MDETEVTYRNETLKLLLNPQAFKCRSMTRGVAESFVSMVCTVHATMYAKPDICNCSLQILLTYIKLFNASSSAIHFAAQGMDGEGEIIAFKKASNGSHREDLRLAVIRGPEFWFAGAGAGAKAGELGVGSLRIFEMQNPFEATGFYGLRPTWTATVKVL